MHAVGCRFTAAAPITKRGDIDYESIVKLADDFNGADLRNVRVLSSTVDKHADPKHRHSRGCA